VEGSAGSSRAFPEHPAERVQAVLERVLEELDIDASIEVAENETEIRGVIEGEDLGLLIGRRGQTIDALQLLCYRTAFRGLPERKRVVVDAAGYRDRRAETLNRQADRAAERALKTGRPIELEPMSPGERKVVHDHLKDRPEIETYSEGSEPERYVVVAPLISE
jgi:spoIIIJ-associated protein